MEAKYRTFWRRFWALVIDSFVLFPIAVGLLALGSQDNSRAVQILLHLVGSFFGVTYSVYLHSRYGQTLGKMATKIRIVDLAGRAIGFKEAVWRDGATLLLSTLTAVFGTLAALDGINPMSLTGIAAIPPVLVYANVIWILAEFITMLTNKRRRAIHDWIAGTLVVRTSPGISPVSGVVAIAGNTLR